nr:hyp [Cotesia vestalis bracovirus]
MDFGASERLRLADLILRNEEKIHSLNSLNDKDMKHEQRMELDRLKSQTRSLVSQLQLLCRKVLKKYKQSRIKAYILEKYLCLMIDKTNHILGKITDLNTNLGISLACTDFPRKVYATVDRLVHHSIVFMLCLI